MHQPFGMPSNLDVAASPAISAEPLERIRSFIRRHWAVIALSTLPGIALSAAVLGLVAWQYQAPILLNKQDLQFFQQQLVINNPTFDINAAADDKATRELYQRLETAKVGPRTFINRLCPSLLSEQLILDKRVQDLLASLTAAIANEVSGLIKRLFL
jgi:hypothetical protein